MSDTSPFTKFVPGFDFLQGLVSNAGAALPGIGQWVAPTLNPQDIEKRINELRTIQFWLEQNTRMLGATIQALEVQRMTLSTLKTMNVQMDDLRESLKIKTPEPSSSTANLFKPPASTPSATTAPQAPAASTSGAPPAGVDPLEWWGTLTQQFTQLAAQALKENTSVVKKPTPASTTPPGAADKVSTPSTPAQTEAKKPAIKPSAKADIKAAPKSRPSH